MRIKADTKENAVVLLQSYFRGRIARKSYAFRQLDELSLPYYDAFLVGNDPKILGLEPFVSVNKRIVLVGTSTLRSLDILGKVNRGQKIPKLIIVDNSRQVIRFWRELRKLIENSHFSDKKSFMSHFKNFIYDSRLLSRDLRDHHYDRYNNESVVYENQNPVLFMNNLIDNYGFNYMLAIIKNMTIIGQSWADNNLFKVLKNIFVLNEVDKIYAYPSNIEACISRKSSIDHKAFLKSLEILSPDLVVSTDLCPHHFIPENIFIKANLNNNSFDNNRIAVAKVLQDFRNKIENIGKYCVKAKEEALKLYANLNQSMEKAFTDPTTYKIKQFATDAKTLIKSASKVLNKDLGWGDYLQNLMKKLANSVIFGITLGINQGFFKVKNAEAFDDANLIGRTIYSTLGYS